MLFAAVDLGTTNVKAALYDPNLRLLSTSSRPVTYIRDAKRVEFDPEAYFQMVRSMIVQCLDGVDPASGEREVMVVLTGQAESFVLIDGQGEPLVPGISWMDMRSERECEEIRRRFGEDGGYRITGQPWVTPTWTATKLRWFRNHHPEILRKTGKVLLLKDYIQYRLTGNMAGEASIRAFSYLMDLNRVAYWEEMLEFCGIQPGQLPDIVPPCTGLGEIGQSARSGLADGWRVSLNAGALDHFCSMVGTGGYERNTACESAGTVLSLSMVADRDRIAAGRKIAFHIGPVGGHVLFQCCDSGGVCMEWYKNALMPRQSYREIEQAMDEKIARRAPIFLPYMTGINPPEYFANARGAFLELTLEHDAKDMAYAVMEGVGFLLKSNLEYCVEAGCTIKRLISTGGGAKSAYWTQLKADLCGIPIEVPDEKEATCRGAAILGAVCAGYYRDPAQANQLHPVGMTRYNPRSCAVLENRYRRYQAYKTLLTPMFSRTEEGEGI